jgi:hypothetical protein
MEFKGDAKSKLTKVLNLYRTWVANIESLLDTTMGVTFGKKYSPELAQSKMETKVHQVVRDEISFIKTIYGLKTDLDVAKQFDEWTRETYELKTITKRGREFKEEIDTLALIDIYNAIKN